MQIVFDGMSVHTSPVYYFKFPDDYDKKYKVRHTMYIVQVKQWNVVYIFYISSF